MEGAWEHIPDTGAQAQLVRFTRDVAGAAMWSDGKMEGAVEHYTVDPEEPNPLIPPSNGKPC